MKRHVQEQQIYTTNRRYVCTLSPLGLRLASARSDSHWPPAQKGKNKKEEQTNNAHSKIKAISDEVGIQQRSTIPPQNRQILAA